VTTPHPLHELQLPLPGIEASTASSLGADGYYSPDFLSTLRDGSLPGGFSYADAPEIFLDRGGYGPLVIGLDTNILVDVAEFGPHLANNVTPPVGSDYQAELEALDILLGLVAVRDIVFYVSPAQEDELRHCRRSREDRTRRLYVMSELLSAAIDYSSGFEGRARTHTSNRARITLPFIRPLRDRLFVEDALANGCHVFLTRDAHDVSRHDSRLRTLGMRAMRPTELLHELAIANELRVPDSPAPDLQGYVHVMNAIGGAG